MKSHLASVYLVVPLLIVAAILTALLLLLAFALHRADAARMTPSHRVVVQRKATWNPLLSPQEINRELWLI